MSPKTSGLVLRHGLGADRQAQAAFVHLLHEVLGTKAALLDAGPWTSFAYFTPDGRCVAGLEAGILPLILDGQRHAAGAIRSVATAADWRGRGLFRELMRAALYWCATEGAILDLLFTETPELYESFGFFAVPQHAFTGAAAFGAHPSAARRLDLARENDRHLIHALVGRRAPVSTRCALLVDAPLFLANIARDDALMLLYDAASDVLVAVEDNGGELVIVDVLASEMPPFATLMRLAAAKAPRVKCLFPPDSLGWDGAPLVEDTGLMIRGPLPPAMARPFMFPPTCEF